MSVISPKGTGISMETGKWPDPLERERVLTEENLRTPAARVQRGVQLAHWIDQFEEGQFLREGQRLALASALEREGWVKLLTRLQPGDVVVSFLSPAGKPFSVKSLNTLLGDQYADIVIAERRERLEQLMREHFATASEPLDQVYNCDRYRIPAEVMAQYPDLQASLHTIAKELGKSMQESVLQLLDLEPLQANPAAAQTLRGSVFQVSFGFDTVASPTESSSSLLSAVQAVLRSTGVAQRYRSAGTHEQRGGAYESEDLLTYILAADALRHRLREVGEFTAVDGKTYPLLEEGADYERLNPEVIRRLRGGTLQPARESEATYHTLRNYLEHLNVFDLLKPYTYEECEGTEQILVPSSNGVQEVSLKEHLEQVAYLAEALRSGRELSDEERGAASLLLSRSLKHPNGTATAVFQRQCTEEVTDCAYVLSDALGVGTRLAQKYEEYIQDIVRTDPSARAEILARLLERAGDETTRELRSLRTAQDTALSKATGAEVLSTSSGGDERIFAVPTAAVVEKEEVLFNVRQAGNNVAVPTRVVAVLPDSRTTKSGEILVHHYVKALRLGESALGVAHDLEDWLAGKSGEERKLLRHVGLADFVLTVQDEEVKVVVRVHPMYEGMLELGRIELRRFGMDEFRNECQYYIDTIKSTKLIKEERSAMEARISSIQRLFSDDEVK